MVMLSPYLDSMTCINPIFERVDDNLSCVTAWCPPPSVRAESASLGFVYRLWCIWVSFSSAPGSLLTSRHASALGSRSR